MEVSLPNWPIAPAFGLPSPISCPRQKLIAAWALKAAMTSRILPSIVKAGALHFSVSSASGAAAWMRLRTCSRIGRAKGAALAI